MNRLVLSLGASLFVFGCSQTDRPPIAYLDQIPLGGNTCSVNEPIPVVKNLSDGLKKAGINNTQNGFQRVKSTANNQTNAIGSYEDLWCRFDNARKTYAYRSGRYHDILMGQNFLIWGAGGYIGSSIALDTSNVNDTLKEDIKETVVGIGLLQSSRLLLNPVNRRQKYDYASEAALCYMWHVKLGYERMPNVARLDDAIDETNKAIQSVESDVKAIIALEKDIKTEFAKNVANKVTIDQSILDQAIATPQQAQKVIDETNAYLSEVKTIRNQGLTQKDLSKAHKIFVLMEFQNFHTQVRRSIQADAITLNQVVESILNTVKAAESFMPSEEAVPGSGPKKDEEAADATETAKNDINNSINSKNTSPGVAQGALETELDKLAQQYQLLEGKLATLKEKTYALQRVTPNFSTLIESTKACRTVLSTGKMVDIDLKDIPVDPPSDDPTEAS